MKETFGQRWDGLWAWVGGAFAPPRGVTGLESFFMRLLFSLVVMQVLPGSLDKTTQPKPNGLAWWLDFTWLALPGMEALVQGLMVGLLICYVVGAGLSLVTPLLLALTVALRTLDNSDGSVHHGYQVVSMVLLAQSAVFLWHAWLGRSLGQRGRKRQGELRCHEEAWVLWASQLAMVSLYAVSVVSKMQNSGGEWLLNSHGFATEVVKTARQNYYSRLDPVWDPNGFPAWAAWIAAHPNLARIMFGAGFFMEALALLALLRWRWVGLLIGFGLIGMHTSIDLVMGLAFPQNVECLWIFFVGLPFLLAWLPNRLGGWLSPATGRAKGRWGNRRERQSFGTVVAGEQCGKARKRSQSADDQRRDPMPERRRGSAKKTEAKAEPEPILRRRRRREHSIEEIRAASFSDRSGAGKTQLPPSRLAEGQKKEADDLS